MHGWRESLVLAPLGIDSNLHQPVSRAAVCRKELDGDALGPRIAGADALAAQVGPDFKLGPWARADVDRSRVPAVAPMFCRFFVHIETPTSHDTQIS